MRYEIAIALLSAGLLGAGSLLRRHFLAPATPRLAPLPAARAPTGTIRRRPF